LLCAALDGVLTAKTWPCSLSQALRAAVSLPSVQGRGRLAVRAARVAGVEIPNQKRLETALTYAPPRRRPAHPPLTSRALAQLHLRHRAHHCQGHPGGDGAPRAGCIDLYSRLRHAQKIENKRTRELSEEELTVLRDEVTKYQVEGDLVCSRRGCLPLAAPSHACPTAALQSARDQAFDRHLLLPRTAPPRGAARAWYACLLYGYLRPP